MTITTAALRGRGPRTPEGKANVRLNGVKHGFFSQQIVISSRAIGEDPKEFEGLLSRLPATMPARVRVT